MRFGIGSRRMAARVATAALVVAGFLMTASASAAPPDEVLLSNGGRLRGTVMEDDPVKGVSIQLLDGTTKRLTRAEVLRVQYAAAAAPAAPQPVAPAPPVAVGLAPMAPMAPIPPPLFAAQPAYERPAHHVTALWVTGLSVWAASYVATISITAAVADDSDKGKSVGEAAIPFFGPWVLIGDGGHDLTGAELGGLVTSGIVQQLSLAMFILGCTVKVGGENSAMTFAPAPMVSGGKGVMTFRF